MSKNPVSGFDAGGDGDGPAVVVCNEVVSCPDLVVTWSDQSCLVKFHKFEGSLVHGRAVVTAAGEVAGDGTSVGVGP